MHLHAALLFQLTVQTVTAFRISQTKSDPRAYLEPRGGPVRPGVVGHPPVIDPGPARVKQQDDGQTYHGTDYLSLKDTAPGLSNILADQRLEGQPDDFGYGLLHDLNSWPDGIPSYAFDPPPSWKVELDKNSIIPLLHPPSSISEEYRGPPIGNRLKRKSSSSGVTYSDQRPKQLKRTPITDFKQQMLDELKEIRDIAEREAKQGEKIDKANNAKIEWLEAENGRLGAENGLLGAENRYLTERLAAVELQALASTTAPILPEFRRTDASNWDYVQAQLAGFRLPFGDTAGVPDFNTPGLTSLQLQDLTYFWQPIGNFPPPSRSHYQNQRRAQSQLHRGINARYTERRQRSHISRRSNSQPTIKDPASEYEFYINVYTEIRVNVSDLLVPYFTPILEQANNGLIYDMVRSIHSDLVAYGPWTLGPYLNGHHCFDWIEYQLFGNITDDMISKNKTILGVLAHHATLIDIYFNIWGNATQIANATGYLAQMHTLRGYLNPKNTSIIPASWMSVQPLLDSLSFDVLYNRTLHS